MARRKDLPEYSARRAEIRMEIGDRIRDEMAKKGLTTHKSLTSKVGEALCLGGNCPQYLSTLQSGKAPGYSTPFGRGVPFKDIELRRVAKVLMYLGVPEEDNLIYTIKTESPFIYPDNRQIPHDGRRNTRL